MTNNNAYTHYGTEFSMYSGKTRSYLRYKGLPFDDRLATAGVYRRILIPNTGVAMIPVLKTPEGDYIQDTTDIIDTLEDRHPERSVYPGTPCQRLASLLIELYADEWLLIPAMHYRWSFPKENYRFIHAEFGKVASPWLPAPIRRSIGKRLGKKFAGFLPLLGVTDHTAEAIEDWYTWLLDALNTHFGQHSYLFGERASVGDFALMAPMYAHLYRDPAPGRIMKERAPNLVKWIERMNTVRPPIGEWLQDDQVPGTLLPILRHQFETQFPVLRETVSAVDAWVTDHPGERLPRKLGEHRFSLGDVEETRGILSFAQWKLQRPLDCYQALDEPQRGPVDALLDQVGGLEAMRMSITNRVKRESNRLVAG